MSLSKWTSRVPRYCYSGMTLIHCAIYPRFSEHPQDACEEEKIIEMQACLLMEESRICELAFFETSPFTEVYPGLRGIEKIDIPASVKQNVGRGFTWGEQVTRGGVGSISRECILCKKCTILHSLVERDL
ncbi:hypothetical protein HJG60_008778 [Phyllostomus discolor]|uniref:Uncharacterized protein n=1 Tax=Phyllostomus discolor TaxID=89673 RepID=A0A833YU05_9CHIR|nr:hypothetical protein HJG60_008778 [Phyllostomus discolor]